MSIYSAVASRVIFMLSIASCLLWSEGAKAQDCAGSKSALEMIDCHLTAREKDSELTGTIRDIQTKLDAVVVATAANLERLRKIRLLIDNRDCVDTRAAIKLADDEGERVRGGGQKPIENIKAELVKLWEKLGCGKQLGS